ncbi:hypothetical protein [Spongiimicrobium sp. 3-5]|uniref:hypothetical protein n=1 Tax=Spongiimicrobium sp. 3-5 TaxID=3332596 RepID=UPI00397EA45C
MIKKSITLAMIGIIAIGSLSQLKAQDEAAESPMWESIILTPDNTKLKILGENMRKHNQKYHSEDGPYKANVFNIASGPNIGKLVWMMGPLKYAHLDSRPAEGGHDEDWRDNVMQYVKKIQNGEYWKGDVALSNTEMLTGDASVYPILFVRYWELNLEHAHGTPRLLKLISETIKGMEKEFPWGVYYNEFRQGTKIGRHVATVGFSKKWAEYDVDLNFKKTFEKVHGEAAWDPFVRDMDMLLDDSWDEVWTYNKELSGK